MVSIITVFLYGYHGEVNLLGLVWKGWRPFTDPIGREEILGIPYSQEWLSFFLSNVFCVLIPCLFIKFVWKDSLSNYGLGLPAPGERGFAILANILAFLVALPGFALSALNPEMKATYPLYRGKFSGWGDFLLYEAGYLPFFIFIEFMWRGFMLFGLMKTRKPSNAVMYAMLPYVTWHIGKPLVETWSTPIWGLAAGFIVMRSRSIWPTVVCHYTWNVIIDCIIWRSTL